LRSFCSRSVLIVLKEPFLSACRRTLSLHVIVSTPATYAQSIRLVICLHLSIGFTLSGLRLE
jgi:hypothetical protein